MHIWSEGWRSQIRRCVFKPSFLKILPSTDEQTWRRVHAGHKPGTPACRNSLSDGIGRRDRRRCIIVQVYIGTSGWVYPWWRGVFYPERLLQREWLGYYVTQFRTVEINASFYRLPTPESLRQWRQAVPPGFLYAVKASQFITHLKRLVPDDNSLARFLDDVARKLGPSLGPILYQLPPQMKKNATRLDEFAARLPQDLSHVFEFRNAEWFDPEIRAILERHKLSFCIHDHGGLSVPHWVTGPLSYWRFHGGREPDSSYGQRALRPSAREMQAQIAAGHEVYAYFNNDAHGSAIRDAQALVELMPSAPASHAQHSRTNTSRRTG